MEVFEALCPAPPRWEVPWQRITETFDWVRRLAGVPQDPIHHAEGDVATHTRMACEALASSEAWRRRPPAERVRLFAAVLLHDAAKPDCTRQEPDGRITSHGHSRRGAQLARRVLWEADVPRGDREHVAALVRHHQVPFWALERDDTESIAFRVSVTASNRDLVELARADITGRICQDLDEILEYIQWYEEYCAERKCLDTPREFPYNFARFEYFRTPGRDPDYAAYDTTRFTVTVMSGLPGVGKDHWIAQHRPGLPVVSLDEIRAKLGVDPSDDQGRVVAEAYAQAREHLRAKRPFVWNATNVTRQVRQRCITMIANYHARVELVALEAPPSVLRSRNRSRATPVPESVMDRLIANWEPPDVTEAHSVTYVDTR